MGILLYKLLLRVARQRIEAVYIHVRTRVPIISNVDPELLLFKGE